MKLQNRYQKFQDAGAEVVALAVAPRSSVDSTRKSLGISYIMLSDKKHRVAAAYGVYNLLGDNLAAPAVFVIDTDGTVLWQYIGKNPNDRPVPGQILEHLP